MIAPRYGLVASTRCRIYHAACWTTVAVAAQCKEKSGVQAEFLSQDEARGIAANIAKLSELVQKP
jgi:hypothetical protein